MSEVMERTALAAVEGCASLAQIQRLQADILASGGVSGVEAERQFTTLHHFAPGMYARELHIPAGATVVGKMHRHAHLNVVSRGRILVASEFGKKEVSAPACFMSEPGIKRVGYALEDTVWTTFHPTNETDLALIEAEVILPEQLSGPDPLEVIT